MGTLQVPWFLLGGQHQFPSKSGNLSSPGIRNPMVGRTGCNMREDKQSREPWIVTETCDVSNDGWNMLEHKVTP